jgi:phage-related protein
VTGDFQGAWTTLKTTLDTTIKDIIKFFTTLDTNVKNVLNELMGKFTEVGTNIATGIANGITDAAGKIATAAKNAASDAYEAAKDFLGMESPSKLMRDKVGVNFSKGMAEGIAKGTPDVVSASRATASIAAETGASIINNNTFSASYANTQSESSLIADTQAMMMTLGASA